MTLKFRYHWSLNLSLALLYPFYLTISLIDPQETSNRFDYLSTYSHLSRASFKHLFTAITSTYDFSQYFSMRCTCIMWGYFLSCCETSLWWLIADQIDIWPMIHDTELIQKQISKKRSLIRTSLINLNWFQERCINNITSWRLTWFPLTLMMMRVHLKDKRELLCTDSQTDVQKCKKEN